MSKPWALLPDGSGRHLGLSPAFKSTTHVGVPMHVTHTHVQPPNAAGQLHAHLPHTPETVATGRARPTAVTLSPQLPPGTASAHRQTVVK